MLVTKKAITIIDRTSDSDARQCREVGDPTSSADAAKDHQPSPKKRQCPGRTMVLADLLCTADTASRKDGGP
jgi:hypothetical protein